MAGDPGHLTPSAEYPTTVATFKQQTNNVQTRLAAPMTATDLTFTVSDATEDLPASGYLTIDNERLEYASKVDATKTFTISSLAKRGIDGSVVTTHAYHANVYANIIALHSNKLAVELAATQTELDAHKADVSTHGVAGSIVGTTDSQTLTSKVVTFTSMTSAARDAAFGATPVTNGTVLYDTDLAKLVVSSGGAWIPLH